MAADIKFIRGSQLAYNSLGTYDSGTLYFVTDANKQAFYLGTQKMSSVVEVASLIVQANNADANILAIQNALAGIDYTAAENADTVLGVIQNYFNQLSNKIGDLDDLNTTSKTNVVGSINELHEAINNTTAGAAVTIDSAVGAEDSILRTYTIRQGTAAANDPDSNIIGVINIPKDLVVRSGRLVNITQGLVRTLNHAENEAQTFTDLATPITLTNTLVKEVVQLTDGTTTYVEGTDYTVAGNVINWITDGNHPEGSFTVTYDYWTVTGESNVFIDQDFQELPYATAVGTFVELTIANQTAPIYIDVAKLLNIYTARQNATQVQLQIINNVISASIVAGSIGTTELADNAVTTSKIADGNITKSKLSAALQASIDLADGSVQSVTEGDNDYTVKVTTNTGSTNVPVHGLKSAALQESTAFDQAGAAASVLGQATDVDSDITVYGARAKADTAETNAKAYADALLTWGTMTAPTTPSEGEGGSEGSGGSDTPGGGKG